MHNTKDELKKEYEELMAEIDTWDIETEDADGKYNEFKEKRNSLRSTWESIKDTADDAWDDVKDGFKTAVDELRDAFNKLRV